MSMEPLSKSYEYYEKAFQVFLDHSTARQAMMTCTQDGTSRALEKIAPIDKTKPFNILGVGSGKGEMDLFMMQFIAVQLNKNKTESRPVIQSVVVEPSSLLLEKFKESASCLPLSLTDLADVSFEWRQITFQEFKHESASVHNEKSRKSPRFDFIHFIHSIYYMDAVDALQSCFEQQLGDKGSILCLVQTEESYFAKVQKKFKGRLTFGSEDMVIYTKEDLAKIAAERGWMHDVIRQEFTIDVTPCFGEPSDRADLLLDWLTHQKNFRATANQELINEVMSFFQELLTTDEGGRKFLKGEMAAVIIEKRQ